MPFLLSRMVIISVAVAALQEALENSGQLDCQVQDKKLYPDRYAIYSWCLYQ
uniref:Uncharacterized protein n=1 Tax=Sarcophilus harrisii TaxID=9305 RepID=A0A7N4P2T7_SARHA